MTAIRKIQQDWAPEPCHNFPVALDLANRGFRVFPIRDWADGDGWKPIKDFKTNASAGAADIADWWRKWPDARIGLPCGERNGIAVLDVDEKNGQSGSATLAALGFPDVKAMTPVRVRTPSGGWHLFFRNDPRLANTVGERGRGIGIGLDIRAQGGFVLAPGSYKAGKHYEPQGSALGKVDLPAWPEALLPPPKPEYEPVDIVGDPTQDQLQWAADYLADLAAGVRETPEGGRHYALNRAALWAGGAGAYGFLTPAQVESALMPSAIAAGLSDREAQTTVKGGWNDGLKKPITNFPRGPEGMDDSDFDDLEPIEAATGLEDTLEDMIGPDLSDNAPAPIRSANDDEPAAVVAKAGAEVAAAAGRDPGGDFALSRSFVAKVQGTMRFCRATKQFMAYSEAAGAWGRNERGEEEQAMLECARVRFQKACAAYRADPSDANERKQAETRSYLKNANLLTRALGMAKSHPELVCLPTDFNTDAYSFPVANGLLDLRTGKLTPPSADLMISKLSPVRFDPAATCPKFDNFMRRIMPDDEVREFLQLAVGYTVTGLVDEERLFLCHGKGANGKSVFANIIAALMGESTTGFSVTVDPLTFVKGSRAGESERNVVSLIGKRLCLVNEIPQGSVWDDGKVKLLTSREQIAARHLYAENVNFWPSHTMWVRANSLPGAHDASDGFWRRVVPVPFTTQIPEDERIGDLDRQIMREELPGVLNWALAGAREYLAAGRLVVPKSLTRLTVQYRDSCDVIGQWFDDRLILDGVARLPSGEAYRAYRSYCAEQGVTAPAQIAFSRTMGERGYPPGKTTGGMRIFNGIKLRTGFDD